MTVAVAGTSRRAFLQASALALMPGAVRAAGASGGRDMFISAATVSGDTHCVRGFLSEGITVETVFSHVLPGRAHHVAVHAQAGLYLVIARRPGSWLAVGRLAEPDSAPRVIMLPQDRRTCGHGFFSPDGSRLYSVETTLATEGHDGLLVDWQVQPDGSPERGLEFSTAGIGPHEAVLMPDGDTVAVANGGYRTSPDSDREILNLDTMAPSLVYLDRHSGKVLQTLALDASMHQNSIRHLDVNADGQVVFAMQFEGEPFTDVPLVGLHRPGDEGARFPEIPLTEQQQLNQYCGSVRFDSSGRFAAVSAPRGNRITFWDAGTGAFTGSVRSRDGCGVCAWRNGFIYTAGTGKVSWFDPLSGESHALTTDIDERLYWDNHLSRV